MKPTEDLPVGGQPLAGELRGDDRARSLYRGASGAAYHQDKRGLPPLAEEWVCAARAEFFGRWVTSSSAVFEYGVGAGWNLARLPCARRVGHDVSADLGPRLKPLGIEFHEAEGTVPAGAFDLVICHHVLEHVPDPLRLLEQLPKWTRPGGQVWLAVPYERERRYRSYRVDEPNHHLFSWNPQTLGNLLRVAGWSDFEIRLGKYGYDRFAAMRAYRWKLGEVGFRGLRAILQRLRPCWQVEVRRTLPGTPSA